MTESAALAAEAIKRHKSHEAIGYLAADRMQSGSDLR
jgi:hypothetical protein